MLHVTVAPDICITTVATSSPLMLGMHARRLAVQPRRLAEKKSRRVQDMTADVGQDELLEFARKGWLSKTGKLLA
jgi:hypothetical protein